MSYDRFHVFFGPWVTGCVGVGFRTVGWPSTTLTRKGTVLQVGGGQGPPQVPTSSEEIRCDDSCHPTVEACAGGALAMAISGEEETPAGLVEYPPVLITQHCLVVKPTEVGVYGSMLSNIICST